LSQCGNGPLHFPKRLCPAALREGCLETVVNIPLEQVPRCGGSDLAHDVLLKALPLPPTAPLGPRAGPDRRAPTGGSGIRAMTGPLLGSFSVLRFSDSACGSLLARYSQDFLSSARGPAGDHHQSGPATSGDSGSRSSLSPVSLSLSARVNRFCNLSWPCSRGGLRLVISAALLFRTLIICKTVLRLWL
jgi:hypothetical protein